MLTTDFARRWILAGLALTAIALAVWAFCASYLGTSAPPPLTQQVYIWQRAWTGSLQQAVSESADMFDGLIVLGAEITFTPSGVPQIIRPPLRFDKLSESQEKVSVAIRIGPYRGPFLRQGPLPRMMANLAAATMVEARDAGIEPAELLLDFECPPGRLAGYCTWLEAIHERVHPLAVNIVVMPDWLDEPAFHELIKFADGYVLRVRTIGRPASPDEPMVLCDPARARELVVRAGSLGRPFRVSLPTYHCQVAFDSDGRFIGLSARGRVLSWPRDAIIRLVPSDPAAMAQLVAEWRVSRPDNMVGVVWDRMPHAGDKNTWPLDALRQVMAGQPATVRADLPEDDD